MSVVVVEQHYLVNKIALWIRYSGVSPLDTLNNQRTNSHCSLGRGKRSNKQEIRKDVGSISGSETITQVTRGKEEEEEYKKYEEEEEKKKRNSSRETDRFIFLNPTINFKIVSPWLKNWKAPTAIS